MVEDELITEAGSDPHAGYESLPTSELVVLMNARTRRAGCRRRGIERDRPCNRCNRSTHARRRTPRLRGAGSSGLLAALDAAECEATFSTPPGS